MARVVSFPASMSLRSAGRLSRGRIPVGRVTAVGALLTVLSIVGSVAFAAVERMDAALAAWVQARHARQEDRKLWALAQADPRLMADLVALQQRDEAGAH